MIEVARTTSRVAALGLALGAIVGVLTPAPAQADVAAKRAAEAAAAAERIRAALELTALPAPGAHLLLSASLGVATLEADPPAPADAGEAWLDQLVRAADRALYQSKAAGRNRVSVAAPVSGL